MTNNPTVRMNVPMPTNVTGVSQSVLGLIGKKPTKVMRINEGEYEILLPNRSACEQLKKFNGKEFSNLNFWVKVREVEPNLNAEDIFLLVKTELTLRDRQDLLQNSSQFPNPNFCRARSVGMESRGGGT